MIKNTDKNTQSTPFRRGFRTREERELSERRQYGVLFKIGIESLSRGFPEQIQLVKMTVT